MAVLLTQFGANTFEFGCCILEIWLYDDIITDRWKVDFEKRALKVLEFGQSIGCLPCIRIYSNEYYKDMRPKKLS